MSGASAFYCVVEGETGGDVEFAGGPNKWATLRWSDEFGNSIAPFFTSRESGRPFLKRMHGWLLKSYPVSFVVAVILADIKQETSFYTIDPLSMERFKTLSPVQFLTELIRRKHPLRRETHDLVLKRRAIVPIEDLFSAGRNANARIESRRLLAAADLIFAIDANSGKQTIVFGRPSLEELLRTGQSNILRVVNVGLNRDTMDIEKLAALVQDIKGHHDYSGAGAR